MGVARPRTRRWLSGRDAASGSGQSRDQRRQDIAVADPLKGTVCARVRASLWDISAAKLPSLLHDLASVDCNNVGASVVDSCVVSYHPRLTSSLSRHLIVSTPQSSTAPAHLSKISQSVGSEAGLPSGCSHICASCQSSRASAAPQAPS